MIKCFVRGASVAQPPESVRTPDVLWRTTLYLVKNILDQDSVINNIYKYLIDMNGKKRVHNYEDITSYVGDRFMAIR